MNGLFLGAIVNFMDGDVERAAIVVRIWDAATGVVNLCCFGPEELLWPTSVKHSNELLPGTWHFHP
jgi:hypothetical protein